MCRTSTNTVIALLVSVALTGCATTKEEVLPHDNATMLDVWNQNTSGQTSGGQSARQLLDARETLRRPLTNVDGKATHERNAAYTRTASNEIYRQFKRLPNPDLVMYVFPHLAGT